MNQKKYCICVLCDQLQVQPFYAALWEKVQEQPL